MRHAPKLIPLFLLFVVPASFAQDITGRLFPEKAQYVIGEPIIVVIELTNNASHPVIVSHANCDSGEFQITNAQVAPDAPGSRCVVFGEGGSSCGTTNKRVAAQGMFEDRMLLHGPGHSHFDLSQPGVYHVEASDRVLMLQTASDRLVRTAKIQNDFDVEIREPYDGELKTRYQRFVDDLSSSDYRTREVAVAALTQNPPKALESGILSLAVSDNAEFRFDSIEGLSRLNTPEAHAKVLEMASGLDGNLAEEAIFALGRFAPIGDCAEMLRIAAHTKQNTQSEAYIAAGRICREKAIPTLTSVPAGADEELAESIATALGNTGSREAMRPLIELLTSRSQFVRVEAESALFTLTHRAIHDVSTPAAAAQVQSDWRSWWFMNSESATIYGPDQCPSTQER
ncbi:MAG: HEAT repeat domain-containing protein [Candidatus Acidiferrales bacterium]